MPNVTEFMGEGYFAQRACHGAVQRLLLESIGVLPVLPGSAVLKGGKNSQMVEKGTEKPNTTPNKQNTTTQGPQAESPPSCSLSSVQGETCETRESV